MLGRKLTLSGGASIILRGDRGHNSRPVKCRPRVPVEPKGAYGKACEPWLRLPQTFENGLSSLHKPFPRRRAMTARFSNSFRPSKLCHRVSADAQVPLCHG
jgi:hypothetical protein